jgi:hypothetical protein
MANAVVGIRPQKPENYRVDSKAQKPLIFPGIWQSSYDSGVQLVEIFKYLHSFCAFRVEHIPFECCLEEDWWELKR